MTGKQNKHVALFIDEIIYLENFWKSLLCKN